MNEILPHLLKVVPQARLVVTGGAPPPEALALESPHIQFVGHVPDLGRVFAEARVVVVPTRIGSGVKIKTVEAMQHGVPVVSTVIGAEGIDFLGAGSVAVCDDPAGFAATVGGLLTDVDRWAEMRRESLCWIRQSATRPSGSSWTEAVEQAIRGRKSRTKGRDDDRGQ